MKKSLEIHPSIIFGMIRQDKRLSINGHVLHLESPYITYIELLGDSKHLNTQDVLTIQYQKSPDYNPRIYNFNFRFPPHHANVNIFINRSIKDRVLRIYTLNTNNIPFKLYYLPVTFNII